LLQRKIRFYLESLVAEKQVSRELILAYQADSIKIGDGKEGGSDAIQAKIAQL